MTIPAQFVTVTEQNGVTMYSVPDIGEVARVWWQAGWVVQRRYGPDPQQHKVRRTVTGDYAQQLAMRHAESFA